MRPIRRQFVACLAFFSLASTAAIASDGAAAPSLDGTCAVAKGEAYTATNECFETLKKDVKNLLTHYRSSPISNGKAVTGYRLVRRNLKTPAKK